MTRANAPHIQLDRASVEGTVIASNLEHLKGVLSEADVDLRADLRAFTKRWGDYVARLSDASAVAAGEQRATTARQRPGEEKEDAATT